MTARRGPRRLFLARLIREPHGQSAPLPQRLVYSAQFVTLLANSLTMSDDARNHLVDGYAEGLRGCFVKPWDTKYKPPISTRCRVRHTHPFTSP